MDDMDDHNMYPTEGPESMDQDPDEEIGQVDYSEQHDDGPKPRASQQRYDEEEDDEDDEEDDEEEDEEGTGRKGQKRAKHRHKRPGVSRFLDVEAEVSDEEEEEEEEEDYGGEDFIENMDDLDDNRVRGHYARLDNQRGGEGKSPEEIARDLNQRYRRTAVHYSGDMNEVPQRLLMPSVLDASLWQVRVKPGRERDIVLSLMRKAIDLEYSAKPLSILSAFQRDSLPGMIYVEASSSAQVTHACNGLVGVFPGRGIHLVPIEEMASLLQIKKQDLMIAPGSWVRIKRGKYAGDLAQVVDITENGEDVGLKFIPRIDLNPRDDGSLDPSKKRKKQTTNAGTMRPPQRLFNYDEIIKVWDRKLVSRRNQVYVFQNDTYKDGFIEKDFKLSALILEDVNPTLDEIQQFSKRQDGAGGEMDSHVDLSVIAEASRKAAIAVLQPGDHVEVFEGEQAGVHGVVEEIHQNVVIITAVGVDLDGQKVELQARSVRKRFKPGDHVKVMTGQNADETGLVVSVADNVVTFLSDMSMQEVSVFSKDLREAAEVGSGTNVVGNYELHDLVQLDAQTVGVIFKTERDTFRVLDQNGQIRIVQPHQISMRRDSIRAIATDSEGHELRINDMVKEVEGEGRKGQVLHIHQSFFAFLHNRDVVENGGVFVTRARSLASLAPKGNLAKAGADLSKMNPSVGAPIGGMVGSGAMGRGPRDRDIGLTVWVVHGPQKGYVGTIKDVNGTLARVELRTGNKVITIDKSKLRARGPDGKLTALTGRGSGESWGGGRGGHAGGQPRTANPYSSSPNAHSIASSSRTPAWNAVGRTPNPYADSGKTPAWNASSRTPNPYADGGKTPAWNVNSRTPNPYAADGGRTPAWNVSARTPNPYAPGGDGGRTPGWNANAKTPNPYASGGGGSGGGGGGGWGTGGDSWGAAWEPQQQSAPTPFASADTPAYNSVMNPPTPGPGAYTTRTPVAEYSRSAPTPAASGYPSYVPGDVASPKQDNDKPDWEWVFDNQLANYQRRMKIRIHGTRVTNYLDGDFEGKKGRILGAARAAANFEQTAMVLFDSGEQRSVQLQYVEPVRPAAVGEEALVIRGKDKGVVVVMRQKLDDEEDGQWFVSLVRDSSFREDVKGTDLIVLYPE